MSSRYEKVKAKCCCCGKKIKFCVCIPPGPTGPTGPIGVTGPTGATGSSGTTNYANFYALMPSDNPGTIAQGSAIAFPQNGPTTGLVIRGSASTFILPTAGDYEVYFQASISEAGQLVVGLDTGSGFVEQGYTVVGRATVTSQIVGLCIVTTTTANTILGILNPSGNAAALTVTASAGGASPVSAQLIIKKL